MPILNFKLISNAVDMFYFTIYDSQPSPSGETHKTEICSNTSLCSANEVSLDHDD